VKDSNVKVPPSALYREGSTAATDILLASEHSVSAPPELGDRIANLCANGVPFGARGTVVAIHDPSEGCVEVVMDEEFIGGSTLQGSCANFRGKLCVWNHLLKISAADSKGIVDHVLPTGSGKAVVDKLMKDIQETESTKSKPTRDVALGEVSNKAKARASTPQKQSVPSVPGRDPKSPWGSPPRSNSSARSGRQGAWREAQGPPEKIIGFTSVGRKAKNGLQEWKKLVAQNGRSTHKPNTDVVDKKDETQESNSEGPLKAMLGVKKGPDPQPPAASINNDASSADASAGLKALLGVAGGSNKPSKPDQPPPPKESAADALMQMMLNDISMPPPPQVVPVQQATQSAFNFSYIKEGEEQPESEAQPQPTGQPPMMMSTMPPAMMPQYFPSQVLPVHIVPPNMMPPHMMPPMYGMNMNQNQPIASPLPPGAASNGTITQAQTPRPSKPKASTTTSATPRKTSNPMVPSVVVKAKK